MIFFTHKNVMKGMLGEYRNQKGKENFEDEGDSL